MAATGSDLLFIGVDVGTSSVRAALADHNGKILRVAVHPIRIWALRQHYYQQSSIDIWQACCLAVREVTSDVDVNRVRGLGFDATCSLVVLDTKCRPLTISPTNEPEQNIVMWLDHRAEAEAKQINITRHSLLKQYGGSISLEQNPSKILWLKKNRDDQWWKNVGHFFDLPDFLTWRATGSLSRSLCSLVCKMAYESNVVGHSWNAGFWRNIQLDDLLENGAKKLGSVVLSPGQPCGNGLSAESALELGLNPGTAVATSMIDAHCGAVGLLKCEGSSGRDVAVTSRLALICGTSTCHMAVSETANYVPGIWGPLYSALLPGLWLNEGGQSATGKLVDFVIQSHPAFKPMTERLKNRHIQDGLNEILTQLQRNRNLVSVALLTKDLHVWPDYHGNRSPLADNTLKGMVSGMTLTDSEESLAILYLATMQALAYGTRHILETMTAHGYKQFKSIVICGGLSKNPLFVQMHADIIGLPVIAPDEAESVLLGGAMLAATASGYYSTLQDAMKEMSGKGNEILPNSLDKKYHDAKYKVFLKMVEHQREYANIMMVSMRPDFL